MNTDNNSKPTYMDVFNYVFENYPDATAKEFDAMCLKLLRELGEIK